MSRIRTVAFAALDTFGQNRVLDRAFMARFHGGEVLTDLAESLQQAGFKVMTLDLYKREARPPRALLLSDMGLGYSRKEWELIPAVCYCLESPIVANRFHHHARTIGTRFHHVVSWRGLAERLVGTRARLHPAVWPVRRMGVAPGGAWEARRFMVAVSGNKKAFQWYIPKPNLHNSRQFFRACLSGLRTQWIRAVDPWMLSELYFERMNAIRHFSRFDSFDLFGPGWDRNVIEVESEMRPTLHRCWKGTLPDGPQAKLDTLAQYRFSYCPENACFPGYVTEKIFDALLAGTIPVYQGAPDILAYVPADCFVDVRRFATPGELADFLQGLPSSEANRYLEAAKEYLTSASFARHTSGCYVEQMVQAMEEVAKAHD